MAETKRRIRPDGIVQSDIQVKLIEAIVKEAYLDLATYADRLDKGTVASKSRAIKNISDKYNLQLEAWANITIPSLYYEGMSNAVNASIKGGQVYEFNQSFVVKHQEALEALINNTYTYTSKISQGIRDSGTRALTFSEQEKIKAEIGKGILTGDDLKTISKGVANVLKESSATAVVSASGRRQGIDSYASNVARSILTDAQWQGTSNTIIEEGYDLVQVSDHFGECALCRPYENEVLSLTGRTKGYTTLAEAKANGLQHVNCRHSISPYTEGLADVSKVWDVEAQDYVYKKDPLTEQAKMMKMEGKTFADFMTVNNIKNYGNINIIDLNNVKEDFFVSRFQQTGFLTQKTSSGISYFAQDKINALNQALKMFAKVGKADKPTDFKGAYSLDKIIDNPLLFKKYPRLKEINVVFADFHTDKKYGLHYANTIFINSKLYEKDPIKLTSTIVHEVQHAKQDIRKMITVSEEIEKGKIKKAWDSQREIDARRQQQLFVESQEAKKKLKKVWDSVQDVSIQNTLDNFNKLATKIGIKDYNLVNQAIKDKDIKAIRDIQKKTKDQRLKESLDVLADYIEN